MSIPPATSNVRRFLNSGALPPKAAVRIEELVNYFNYDYPQPEGDAPFSRRWKSPPHLGRRSIVWCGSA
jgi:hypothetical protein